jgi:protein disulfide-isomerase A1
MEKMMFAVALFVALLMGHVHMGVSSEAEAPPVVDVPSDVDVVVLDASNFTQTIEENAFVLVEFYAPWCGHCKRLAPEYAKAATELKSHDHPKIILAKVDANDEQNKELASLHGVQGFPTLKVFRDGGESVRHYNGPRDAQGIVAYLKQMAGPPSHLLSSLEEAEIIVKENPLTVVGVFNDLENTEYQEFLSVADELRSEYNFTHTFDTSYVPKTGVDLSAPAVRLYKNFDEGFNDASDLSPDGLKSFLDAKGVPLVVEMNKDPANHAALVKFFNGVGTKVFLFLDLKGEGADEYRTAYHNLAKAPHSKVLKFLIADAAENENALKFFGIKEDKVPAIVVQGESNGEQYLALDIKVSELDHWLQDCLVYKAFSSLFVLNH